MHEIPPVIEFSKRFIFVQEGVYEFSVAVFDNLTEQFEAKFRLVLLPTKNDEGLSAFQLDPPEQNLPAWLHELDVIPVLDNHLKDHINFDA